MSCQKSTTLSVNLNKVACHTGEGVKNTGSADPTLRTTLHSHSIFNAISAQRKPKRLSKWLTRRCFGRKSGGPHSDPLTGLA